jgi:hypothetical protein
MADHTTCDQADPIARVHQRLDDLFGRVDEIGSTVAAMSARCGPCQDAVKKHEQTLYGNGQSGLVARVSATEQGRVDTMSVTSVVKLLAAFGSLMTVVAAAIGGLVAALAR